VEILKQFALAQAGVVARWQLLAAGVDRWIVDRWADDLRTIFPGVYLTGWAPVTPEQRRWAATLTAPDTFLADESAAAHWEVGDEHPALITVVRPGQGGPWHGDGIRVRFSTTLTGNVCRPEAGPPVTTPERTVIDRWAALDRISRREKLLREMLRRRHTTAYAMTAALRHHGGHRGVAELRRTISYWRRLPFHRCRSDAEAFALTVLEAAGVEIPSVNVYVAGHEADLVWMALRRLVEIDGPSYHPFKEIDAIKTDAWMRAGWRVDRLPSDELFADPQRLLVLSPAPTRRARRTGPHLRRA